MWDFGLTWALVHPDVATFARACAYDRGGLGWSDLSPRPRTAEPVVEELRILLSTGGVPPPYVLVAHSSSGILARLFAHRHPEMVAGMVLVDSAHEEQFLRFPESVRKAQDPIWAQQRAMVSGLRDMIEARTLDPAVLPVPPRLPQEAARMYRTLVGSTTKLAETMLAELDALEEVHAQARRAEITSLGDIPLIVLRHGDPPPPFPDELAVGEEDLQVYEDTWGELQEELASLSTAGRIVVAEGAGHMIHHDRPDLVVQAIREVVEAARSRWKG